MRLRKPLQSILLLAGLLGGIAPDAAAQQPATTKPAKPTAQSISEQKEAAKAAADRAFELFTAGKYAEALTAFQETDKLFHAPTFSLMIARTQHKLGQLLEARATYQQIVGEQLVHYAPKAFFEAQEKAKTELAALVPRIPTMQVTVTGAPAHSMQLTINGQPAEIGQALLRNPGDYTLTASAPGYVSATKQVTLEEGAPAQVTLELAPEAPPAPPPAPPPPPASPPPAQPTPVAPTPPAADTTPARQYASPPVYTFGFAGVALGVGAITGAMSSSEVDKLEQQCPDKKCYDDADDTYSSAHTLSAVSTISFVLGGLIAAGGVVLLVVDAGDDQPAKTGLAVGPGWLGVKGNF